jgi:hypothetical protein
VAFSEARDLFVNNFGKPEGLKRKMSEITEFWIYF